jgi:hypothetical protein
MKALAIMFAVLAAAACGPGLRDDEGDDQIGDDGGDGDGGGGGGGGGVPRQCNQMDIVFVVDDSGSMQEEQSNLTANFPMFATLLSDYTTPGGEKIDFRVAVTTTGKDLQYTLNLGGQQVPFSEQGDDGAFRNNCGAPSRWLSRNDANMQQALACRASVGTGGPSYEMPLLMAKWALDKRVADGTNAGFVRPDALLAIVMLTDEDDASTEKNNFVVTPTSQPPIDYQPADHVAFLDALKGHRSRWAAAAIAGDGDCSSAFGDAANAARLKDFVSRANGGGTTQATFSSICDGDLTIGLKKALMLFQAACGDVIL